MNSPTSWTTHDVTNVVPELKDYNLYQGDVALQEGVRRAGAVAHQVALLSYGAALGSEQTIRWAEDANRFKPELRSFDRTGHRVDQVVFHESWHHLMRMFRQQNLVSQPFSDGRPGAWSAFAAGFSMHAQIEDGSLCPNSMTFACIPVLQKEPALFAQLGPKLYSTTYDARDLPLDAKHAALIGMGMTEKQGGSDVRSNTTVATAVGAQGRGAAYTLVGHKWFFSAPMCDAHLVLARTVNGLSCFYVPRFRPDGSQNAVHIQRLKDKLGNVSNASSEVEFHGAWGLMVGDEGRGIATIIEMANYTRLHCVIGSAGMMRQALVQAIHHARHRHAFGKPLVAQPLMQNVLADMALESEAATHLMMRLARAFERMDTPLQRAYQRIVTPAAKFWVCKRAVELAGEAMEVWGGNGYVQDAPTARLFRNMPVNSIWEGSGNVMCLDVLRAIGREPEAMQALLDDLGHQVGGDARLQPHWLALRLATQSPAANAESDARRLVRSLVLLVQASLLLNGAPVWVSDAFVASRWGDAAGGVYGLLPASADTSAIISRAWG